MSTSTLDEFDFADLLTDDFNDVLAGCIGDAVREIMERPVAGASLRETLPQVSSAVLSNVAVSVFENVSRMTDIWKGGKVPPTFPQFCKVLDGQTLFPHQLKCIEESGLVTPYDLLDPNRTRQVLLFIWGKGSGKDYMCAKFCAWIVFVLNSLVMDPAEYLGLAPCSRVSILNIAAEKDQAKKVFFDQYLKRFIKHKIFREAGFVVHLRDGGKQIQGDKILFHRYDEEGNEYESVGLFSMSSSVASNEGHNVFAFVMDEADSFHDAEERSNADDLYNIFTSSATTRFGSRYVGMIISYPRTENGFVMRLKKVAEKNVLEKGDKANYYADLAGTAVVNPKFSLENDVVQQHFKDNPLEARAMYLCLPAGATEAFIEFPERIAQSVDASRTACAEVITEDLTLYRGDVAMHFITPKLTNFLRVPGYRYFLSGDAGAKSDAYGLTIWHYDANADSSKFLCPRCGNNPKLTRHGEYERVVASNARYNVTAETSSQFYCGGCHEQCTNFSVASHGKGSINMIGWYKRSERDDSKVKDANGNVFNVKHLYEDLIVQIRPKRAVNMGDVNKLVHFPGVQQVCKELIQGLGIQAARFDPWQTYEVTQGLLQSTGIDVGEILYSRPEQYKRARWAKKMLYGGLIHFLPCEERDREWRQLQDQNRVAIDHPKEPGASKDLFDAESACIWTASSFLDQRITISFV